MYKTKLNFSELFKPNSLRNLVTYRNSPMPHIKNTYYLWVENYSNNKELSEMLTKGNKLGINSINSYIDLSELAHEEISSRLIQCGPNSTSSSFTIRVVQFNDDDDDHRVLITASGWGSSVIELYNGPTTPIIEYFKEFQNR